MTTELDELGAQFHALRPRLFGIAYRMLGSAVEAEDVVQDAWIRWQTTDRSEVRSPLAFLSTTTARLAINASSSFRLKRAAYVGPWLPEPVFTDDDPELGAQNSEALEIGLLMLMERLTPSERAVYLLREAFDYPFAEIAAVLETSEANARQLARRARVHLGEKRAATVTVEQKNRLLRAFVAAAQSGDLERLQSLLTDDIVSYSDGGGVVSAARRPIVGRVNVERFLVGALEKTRVDEIEFATVNGADAFLVRRGGEPYLLGTVGATAAGIDSIFLVVNPEKLGAVRARGSGSRSRWSSGLNL